MTRAASGDVVSVPAGNNVYTVLVIAGFIANAIALAVLFIRANTLGIKLF